jgi:dTMP kinase
VGSLIVFEGIDGSGKSTQFEMMCNRFLSENRLFKRLVFPRYSEPSSALIRMYLGGEFGDNPDSVNAYAASSFYAVDRYASYMQDWREFYENGGLILTDRYTTSNALHQGAKVAAEKRELFFKWLNDYEFNLIGLPTPDMVMYMDIDAEFAAGRLRHREAETDTSADIHENDIAYLCNCAQSGRQAAALYGWHSVNCMSDGVERDKDDIHIEVYNKLRGLLA